MKSGNIGRALFVGIFVGVISFIKELFFPQLHSLAYITLIAVAALVGYWLGNKIWVRREEDKTIT